MKRSVLHLSLRVTPATCLLALLCLSSVSAASPPPSHDVPFCLPLDFEERGRDSLYAARKQALDLNVGEPRTVRMIYFLPNDRPFRADVVDSMKTAIRRIQIFYAEQMQAHGYGNKTFRFETDAQDEPMVHRVDGQHPDSHYLDNTPRSVLEELERVFDVTANIYFIAIDNSINAIDRGDGNQARGVGIRRGKNGGYALFTGEFSQKVAAHELGHSFGLKHDFNDDVYIMSYGANSDSLSECNAEFLAVHPYFNPDNEALETSLPKIELISPTKYPTGSKSVSVQLRVSDSEGLHQVILFVRTRGLVVHGLEVKSCRGLGDEKDAVVEFDYDGVIPYNASTSHLSGPAAHQIFVDAVDTDGNVSHLSFWLWEISPQHIATLEGHKRFVRSVAFSPDGTTLASGSPDKTVKLWDVATGRNIATLGHMSSVTSVTFSPDGTTLASGSGREIKLWDVATERDIATLGGHTNAVNSVAFSPDGTTLASGAWGREIKLWDVATERNIATLRDLDFVESVAFSPDGTILASGAWGGTSSADPGTVRLWDVSTRRNIATLEGHKGRVTSVAFSPDGTTLVSGSDDETVKLWDVATETDIATLEGHESGVRSVAFSPDGATLASGSSSGSWDNTVKLWDVATQTNVASYRHVDNISSTYNPVFNRFKPSGRAESVYTVAFSPDGTTLASGAGPFLDGNGTIILWDASEWTRSRPQTLEKISGDNQQSSAGSELTDPFVVEVRDQNGDLLQGVEVRFAVTAGDGKLSGKYNVENTVTDADGRARTTLTLGPNPGTNTVEASVAGIVSKIEETFNAVGVGTPTLEGDYRTWHLPDGAIARLGKGSISGRDRAVTFSPNGQLLAVASGIGVWLYDVANSTELTLLTGHIGGVRAVAFSPDSTMLVSGSASSYSGTLKLWDVATGHNIATLGGYNRNWRQGINSVAFSPDGTTIAAGSYGEVNLWNVETRTNVATLEGHERWVHSVAYSPDGAMLASGLNDDKVELWNIAARENIATLKHSGLVHSVAFSPHGKTLASGGSWTVRLWDVATRTNVSTLRTTGGAVAFSEDGATLASAGSGTVQLWDVKTAVNLTTLYGGASSVAFSPDGTTLASGAFSEVRLWDIQTRNSITINHSSGVRSLAFSPDGTTLASGGSGTAQLWDVATRTNFAFQNASGPVAFFPDGATLVTRNNLWNVATRTNFATLSGSFYSVAISPDGTTLASGGTGSTVKLYDIATRQNFATLEGHTGDFNEGAVQAVAFSPDGATLASGSRDRTIKLWNVATRKAITTLEGHSGTVESVAFSPDGTTLASGSRDRTVKLWNVATERNIATRSHRTEVLSVVFSPDGKTLVSGSASGGVLLWNPLTNENIASLDGHTGWVRSVAFSPDGTMLASGSSDGTVLLWNMSAPGASSELNSSLSLDGNTAAGDQAVTSLDVSPGSVVSIQVFGKDIQNAKGFSARFEYDANQVVYEGFDPGGVLPNARVLSVPTTNPTAVEINMVSFGAQAASDSGLVGNIRFRTTDAFSGTTLRLVRAEIGRGDQRESVTLSDTSVTLQLAVLTSDFNGDGRVDFGDFLLFAGQFGANRGDGRYEAKYDLDEDGTIGFGDFLIFGSDFGKEGS